MSPTDTVCIQKVKVFPCKMGPYPYPPLGIISSLCCPQNGGWALFCENTSGQRSKSREDHSNGLEIWVLVRQCSSSCPGLVWVASIDVVLVIASSILHLAVLCCITLFLFWMLLLIRKMINRRKLNFKKKKTLCIASLCCEINYLSYLLGKCLYLLWNVLHSDSAVVMVRCCSALHCKEDSGKFPLKRTFQTRCVYVLNVCDSLYTRGLVWLSFSHNNEQLMTYLCIQKPDQQSCCQGKIFHRWHR